MIGSIKSAEQKFRQILEDFFISAFDGTSLSSHGLDHHRRVWNYSKELIPFFGGKNNSVPDHLPSKLIIACYLHDIGMSVEPGISHGKHSKDLCIHFLVQNNLNPKDYQDVLEAIENHDIKDYQPDKYRSNILIILSLADDLDAFGFIGIFRYLEIYLFRGEKLETIGYQVLENAKKRFENFLNTLSVTNELTERHVKRYKILHDFFNEYNNMIPSYQFGTNNPSGYCGVAEAILGTIKNNSYSGRFCNEKFHNPEDPVLQWFCDGFHSEL